MAKAKILIIEDDLTLVEMYKKKFSQEGYEMIEAYNGQDGLLKAQEEKPDLILLDIMMPKMDGFQVLEKLKNDPLLAKIPVMILTNIATKPEDIKRAKKLGACDYIIKANFVPSEIIQKVKNHLAK